MPPSIASLSARGRSFTSQSTILHVLRLVQANYVPESLPLRQRAVSRRQYVSAQPKTEDEIPHRTSIAYPPSEARRRARPAVPPERSAEEITRLLSTWTSARKIMASKLTDEQLLSVEAIHRLFIVWEKLEAPGQDSSTSQSPGRWRWLRIRMEGLETYIESLESRPRGLRSAVQALRAYATMKDGGDPRPILAHIRPASIFGNALASIIHTSRGEWADAKVRLGFAIPPRMSTVKLTEPVLHVLRTAQEDMINAGRAEDFGQVMKNRRSHVYKIMLANTNHRKVHPELNSIFVNGLLAIPDPVGWLTEQIRSDEAAYEADDGGRPRKARIIQKKLPPTKARAVHEAAEQEGMEDEDEEGALHEDSVLEGQSALDEESALHQVKGRSEGFDLPPGATAVPDPISAPTKSIAAMVFMAYTTLPAVARTGLSLFRRLVKWGVFIPPHHAMDLCEHLDKVERGNLRRSIRYVVSTTTGNNNALSYSVCKRLLYVLLQYAFPNKAAVLLTDMIARFPDMSQRDRTIPARYFAQRGEGKRALEFLQMIYADKISTDIESLELMISIYQNTGNEAGLVRILEILKKQLTEPTHADALIRFYARQNNAAEALHWFQEFLRIGGQPTIELFTTLMKLFSSQGDTVNVDRMVQGAIDVGMQLTPPFCEAVLDAGVRAQDWLTVARRWESFPAHLKFNPAVMTPVLRAFVHLAVPYRTIESFFRRIANPSAAHWALLQLAACDKKQPDLAEKLLEEMRIRSARRPDAARPSVFNYSIILHGYLRVGQDKSAKLAYDAMQKNLIVPSSITYGMILSSYLEGNASAESYDQAHVFAHTILRMAANRPLSKLALRMNQTKAVLYSRLIDNAGRLGRPERALRYYSLATKDSPPTVVLQTILMMALRRSNEIVKVLKLWEETFSFYVNTGIGESKERKYMPRSNALCAPLSITLDALGQATRYEDLKKVWHSVSKAGFGLDAGNYNSYAIALLRCGDIHGAAYVVTRVLLRIEDAIKARNLISMRSALRLERLDTKRKKGVIEPTAEPPNRPVTDEEVEQIQDAPSAPSDSQPLFRKLYQSTNPDSDFFASTDAPLSVIRGILTRWRPGDRQWGATLVLHSLFFRAFNELRALAKEETAPDAKDSGPRALVIPSFGVALRDHAGDFAPMTATQLLEDLNKTYPVIASWVQDYEPRFIDRNQKVNSNRGLVIDDLKKGLAQDWADLEAKYDKPELSDAELSKREDEIRRLRTREIQLRRAERGLPTPDPVVGLSKARRRPSRRLLKARNGTASWGSFLGVKKAYQYYTPWYVERMKRQARERREQWSRERALQRDRDLQRERLNERALLLEQQKAGVTGGGQATQTNGGAGGKNKKKDEKKDEAMTEVRQG